MRDLGRARFMWTKAALLLVIGLACGALLIAQTPTVTTILLLALCVWAFSRAYYFAFYVIERYIDPAFRFSGLVSVVVHLWKRRAAR